MIENFSFDILFCCKLRLSTKDRSKDKVNLTNSNYNLYIEALWTIRDSKLINKASLWKSDDDWVLEQRESLFIINVAESPSADPESRFHLNQKVINYKLKITTLTCQ